LQVAIDSWRSTHSGCFSAPASTGILQALTGCGKDRVRDGGNDRRCPRLAHATRRFRAVDDVDLNGRCLIHAQHLVGIEVGLRDTAVLERDLAMERGRGAKDDAALDLISCSAIMPGRSAFTNE
jgi:hypothetical protein